MITLVLGFFWSTAFAHTSFDQDLGPELTEIQSQKLMVDTADSVIEALHSARVLRDSTVKPDKFELTKAELYHSRIRANIERAKELALKTTFHWDPKKQNQRQPLSKDFQEQLFDTFLVLPFFSCFVYGVATQSPEKTMLGLAMVGYAASVGERQFKYLIARFYNSDFQLEYFWNRFIQLGFEIPTGNRARKKWLEREIRESFGAPICEKLLTQGKVK